MVQKKLTEDDLCSLLAGAVMESADTRAWLLGHTKFNAAAGTAHLLHEEQMSKGPRKAWWRHWWTPLPDGTESETDIFMVFESAEGSRFALHVEIKLASGSFTKRQPENYALRAAFMAGKEAYLDYSDYQTILIAPSSFQLKFPRECREFDVAMTFDRIARVVPDFSNYA